MDMNMKEQKEKIDMLFAVNGHLKIGVQTAR
jgi:hypothetical protein